ELLEARGLPPEEVPGALRVLPGVYDPAIIEDLAATYAASSGQLEEREVTLDGLRVGMIFAEDVRTRNGMLLVARGHAVTESLLMRIRNFAAGLGLCEPLRVAQLKPTAPERFVRGPEDLRRAADAARS